jgi:hypothetical protein
MDIKKNCCEKFCKCFFKWVEKIQSNDLIQLIFWSVLLVIVIWVSNYIYKFFNDGSCEACTFLVTAVIGVIAWIQLGKLNKNSKADMLLRIAYHILKIHPGNLYGKMTNE